MQNFQGTKLSELLETYERALAKYGLSVATRLNMVSRASVIIRCHRNHGEEYFCEEMIYLLSKLEVKTNEIYSF